MPDTINELLQELVGYGVPEPVVYAYAAELIKYGADSAVYRRETADAIARETARRDGMKWPSGRRIA